jgi:hypothetical protein
MALGPRLTFEVQATSEVVDMVVLAISVGHRNGVEIGSCSLVKPRKKHIETTNFSDSENHQRNPPWDSKKQWEVRPEITTATQLHQKSPQREIQWETLRSCQVRTEFCGWDQEHPAAYEPWENKNNDHGEKLWKIDSYSWISFLHVSQNVLIILFRFKSAGHTHFPGWWCDHHGSGGAWSGSRLRVLPVQRRSFWNVQRRLFEKKFMMYSK